MANFVHSSQTLNLLKAKLYNLPRIEDPRGNLSFIEHGRCCPFEIGRAGWYYDMPAGAALGHSAPAKEMIVAMSGSFDVDADGEIFRLDRSDRGVVIEKGANVRLLNFSTNSVALALAAWPDAEAVTAPSHDLSHRMSDVAEAHIIALPRIANGKGSLTSACSGDDWLPFNLRRVFYLFDVPADAERGGHSHYEARELIVALSGSFDVVLSDGKHSERRFTLNRPYQGLYVPTGLWRTLDNFSGGAVCMVLTSEHFSEADYVREYDEFIRLTAGDTIS